MGSAAAIGEGKRLAERLTEMDFIPVLLLLPTDLFLKTRPLMLTNGRLAVTMIRRKISGKRDRTKRFHSENKVEEEANARAAFA